MNIDKVEIKEYYRNEVSLEIKAFMYSLVIGFLLVLLIVIMNLLKKDLYYVNNLIIEGNQYATINVLLEDLKFIENNNYLIIDNKKYYYKVVEIEIINDINLYYQVRLKLDNNLLINSINSYKILIRKENIFNYIVRVIKGG